MVLRCLLSRAFVGCLIISGLVAFCFGTSASAQAPVSATPATPSLRYSLGVPAAGFTLEMEGVDRGKELRADMVRSKSLPLRYAVERKVATIKHVANRELGGEWRDLADGMALWRIPVHVPNALTLDFGFRRFFLPPGAQLFIHNDNQTLGPYSDTDNPRSHVFWTPLIYGDNAQIEVLLPQAMKPFLELDLGTVHTGYRDIFRPKSFFNADIGSGACNVDTICPQGDLWRREINAEAVLVSGGMFCSGQLVNNTRGDRAALLTTAHHCYSTAEDASGLVVYWKYESPTCRVIGSEANSQPVPTINAIAQTGGATLLATDHDSDFTLFQLIGALPQAANVYFNGWDRGETAFSDGIAIHHPGADAKRLSFTADSIVTDNTDYGLDANGNEEVPGLYHWRVDHYLIGTTEPGSSGGGLLDASHRLRGMLSGGSASCSEPDGFDEYGRISAAWTGGGTADSRLSDWLDPVASGATQLDGIATCTAPTVSLGISANPALVGNKIVLTASATGGIPPYTYAFDVDGDGITDSTDPTLSSIPAVYPGAYSGNVNVSVTDSTGCSGVTSRALVVLAPQIAQAAVPLPSSSVLCGGTSSTVNPGQRWRTQVALVNNGKVASQAGYAIFAQDPDTLAATKLTLETPAVALPALAPGQTKIVNLDYAIDATDTCVAPVKIDLVGAVDARGFSAAPTTVVDTAIASSCNAVTTCPALSQPQQLDAGSYFDALRPGNGMTLATIAQGTNDPVFFGLWFSGDAARQPIWYQVQAALHANQVNSPLYQEQQSSPPTWPLQPIAIGSAQITLVDTDKFVFTWNFNGNIGGALYTPTTAYPSTIRIWYNPSQSGWGVYDQLVQVTGATSPPLIASLAYIYDSAGMPRWIQANNPSYSNGATLSATSLRPTCPGCIWLDYNAGAQPVGTLIYTGSGTDVQISTNFAFPEAIPGSWIRSQFPLTALYRSP